MLTHRLIPCIFPGTQLLRMIIAVLFQTSLKPSFFLLLTLISQFHPSIDVVSISILDTPPRARLGWESQISPPFNRYSNFPLFRRVVSEIMLLFFKSYSQQNYFLNASLRASGLLRSFFSPNVASRCPLPLPSINYPNEFPLQAFFSPAVPFLFHPDK